jgi:hypothetical protein
MLSNKCQKKKSYKKYIYCQKLYDEYDVVKIGKIYNMDNYEIAKYGLYPYRMEAGFLCKFDVLVNIWKGLKFFLYVLKVWSIFGLYFEKNLFEAAVRRLNAPISDKV